MRQFGKSIRLFLTDGTVTGIRFGEIVNQTIQSISCPRNRIIELSEYPESSRPGVYFLFGIDEDTGDMKAYIGEAENVYSRLQSHILKKDFWSDVVIFVAKDENLTKAHVKYLESRLVEIALRTQRYTIENGNQPQAPSLPRGEPDTMEEFLYYIKLLIGTLGYRLLEDINPATHRPHQDVSPERTSVPEIDGVKETNLELFFSLKKRKLRASAVQTDEGIVVLANSEASRNQSDKLQHGYRKLRENLIKDGTLDIEGGKYIFQKNQLFPSPSAAASVIAGTSRNGRDDWKDEKGMSIKEIEEGRIKSKLSTTQESIAFVEE